MSWIKGISTILSGRNTLNAVFWFSALGFLRPAVNIFLLPLYLLVLTPEDYGVLALIGIFTAVAATVSNLRVDAAMRTFYFDYNQERESLWRYLSQIFSLNLTMVLIAFGILLLAGPILYDWLFINEEVRFFPLGVISLAAAFFSSCTSIYFIYLKNQMRLKEFFTYAIWEILAMVILQYYFTIHLNMGILGILYGALIPNALSFILIVLLHPGLVTFSWDRRMIAPSLKFALPLVPFSFLFVAEKQMDKFFIEKYLNLEMVGLYALLLSLVGLVAVLFTAMDNAIRPYLYQVLKDNAPQTQKQVSNYFGLYLMVGLLGLSGVILVGCNLDLITSNAKYLSVRDYFTFACCATLPVIFVRFYALLFIYFKKSAQLTLATAAKTLVMIFAFIALIPAFGIYGALTALFISHMANLLIFKKLVGAFNVPTFVNQEMILVVILFLVLTWSLYLTLGSYSLGAFGLIQFLIMGSALIYLNLKRIRSLAAEQISTRPNL